MAKKKEQVQQTDSRDTRVIYAGPTIINEKFFLRKGQIFTEVPRYAPKDLKKFFVPLSEYSPDKEKELEKERQKYIKEQQRKKKEG